VHHIELAAKRVAISRDSSDYLQQIGYDHLVIALGSVTNFHDLAELRVALANENRFLMRFDYALRSCAIWRKQTPDVITPSDVVTYFLWSQAAVSQVLKRLQR